MGGNNAIAVRFSNVEMPPMFGAAVRFAGASILLFLVVAAMRLPLPRGRSLAGVLVFGVLQFGISYALIYWSLTKVQAGLFQTIFAVVPLFTFVLAILYRQETFQWRVLAGGLLALAGIAVIFSARLSTDLSLAALWAIVLAAACIAESIVLLKTVEKPHPITANAIGMGIGAALLFGMSWIWRETPSMPALPATWIAIVYLVLFGSIGLFVLALYVLAHWTASATSYQLVLMPIVTVIFSSWLAGEEVTPALLFG